jgi:hypothetical protein
MLAGTTPSDPHDRGAADPVLAAALGADDTATVLRLLPAIRLLVPVVAMPGSGEAEMAVPALVNAAGARALPVFSSVAALHAWQADARPVPMRGARVIAAAVEEGYDGVVVDVAGPHSFEIEAADLRALLQRAAADGAGC